MSTWSREHVLALWRVMLDRNRGQQLQRSLFMYDIVSGNTWRLRGVLLPSFVFKLFELSAITSLIDPSAWMFNRRREIISPHQNGIKTRAKWRTAKTSQEESRLSWRKRGNLEPLRQRKQGHGLCVIVFPRHTEHRFSSQQHDSLSPTATPK